MMPCPEDFVEKNGKLYPNLSKNKNRLKPTMKKIKVTLWSQNFNISNEVAVFL